MICHGHELTISFVTWYFLKRSWKVLNCLSAGKAENHSAKDQRMVISLGLDICRTVTRGQWKLLKHVLTCLTLWYLFRNPAEQVWSFWKLQVQHGIENGNRLVPGWSWSYLSIGIVIGITALSLFLSKLDNFDLLFNVLEWKRSVLTAHRIMMQEASRLVLYNRTLSGDCN